MKRVLMSVFAWAQNPTLVEEYGYWSVWELEGNLMDEGYLALAHAVNYGDNGGIVAFLEQDEHGFYLQWKIIFPDYLGSRDALHEQPVLYATNLSDEAGRWGAETVYRGETDSLYLTDLQASDVFGVDGEITEVMFRTWDYANEQHDTIIPNWDAESFDRAVKHARRLMEAGQ